MVTYQVCDLDQKPSEVKSKGHLILTKQTKHLVQKLENVQDNNNVLCMLQYISSSSWSPKRSHQPWEKKERKTLSKMNIAQSINFPIPPPTAGSQAIKSPPSGNTSTDILSSHPQFFSNFLLWAGGRLWSNKTHFYLQINLEIKSSRRKRLKCSSLLLFSFCMGWADQQLSVHYCPLLSSCRKKCSESIYVNIYSIKQGFMKKGLRSENENV